MGENGEHDATVRTLTAEVRVLMVGSRQVTLSVFAQLDVVDRKKMIPFGRVSPRDGKPWETWLVGRHRESGALVRSWILTPEAIDELIKYDFIAAAGAGFTPDEWARIPLGDGGENEVLILRHDAEAFRVLLPLIVLAGLR